MFSARCVFRDGLEESVFVSEVFSDITARKVPCQKELWVMYVKGRNGRAYAWLKTMMAVGSVFLVSIVLLAVTPKPCSQSSMA